MIYIILICLFILFGYFLVYYLDYKKKKKKLLNLVGKKVLVIIGKPNIADVRVNGVLCYDVKYLHSVDISQKKLKPMFYVKSNLISAGKLHKEEYSFNVFELKYIFLLSCNN